VTVLAVDLGKTSSRVALVAAGRVLCCLRAAGTPGLAHPAGLSAALAVTVRLAREVTAPTPEAPVSGALGTGRMDHPPNRTGQMVHPRVSGGAEAGGGQGGGGQGGVGEGGGLGGSAPRLVGIGVAGARTGAVAAAQLAAAVREALGVEQVAVTNDAVTAHVGALGGGPGVVLIAGTGAVALGIGAAGQATIVDGAGWWLGDDGSGAWVGAGGLRAVLRAADGRGPRTALSEAAIRRFGSLDAVRALAGQLNPAAAAASFGPDVAGAAVAGDAVAVAILDEASAALAATTMAAVRTVSGGAGNGTGNRTGTEGGAGGGQHHSFGTQVGLGGATGATPGGDGSSRDGGAVLAKGGWAMAGEQVPVALVGGLTEWGDVLLGPWRAALGPDVRVVDAPPHAALLGAAELAARTDLPHEPLVHRAAASVPRAAAPVPRDAAPVPRGTAPVPRGTAPVPRAVAPVPRGCGISPIEASERHILARGDGVDGLPTEQVRPGLRDLDTRRSGEIVELMLAAEAAVPAALAAAAPQLAAAVDLAVDRMADGGRLIYVGAGTPGRLAALDAAECGPTFGVAADLVIAVLAGGQQAATEPAEGAEDDAAAGRADLAARRITPDDVVVGISASGRTPYVLGALAEAAAANAATVAIVNNAGSPIAAAADIAVELLTGPEVIAGSTRLTAGTAQKVALNVLSTAIMVRLGKTFGGWMVDVRPGNDKLRRRALRIVREAAGVDAETARRALDEAAGETPTALVSLLLGVDAATARARLAAAGGRVRGAITASGAKAGPAGGTFDR